MIDAVNLVVGATGLLGSDICRRLAGAKQPVRALVRFTSDPAKVEALKRHRITLVAGDLKDRASLLSACRGVTTVVTTVSSTFSRQPGDSIQTVDHDGQLRLIDAARASGVTRFIYISYSHQLNIESPLTTAKRTVERQLLSSGLTYTILAPTFYMEVWLSPALGFDPDNGTVQIYGSGTHPISWISAADVAQFAVAAIDTPAAANATVELGGPDALTPLQVVAAFEAARGRKLAVTHVPEDALRAQYAAATDPLQRSFAALTLGYAVGDAINMRMALRLFPIALLSVPQYAARKPGA
jgi:NADH dehydrogenase